MEKLIYYRHNKNGKPAFIQTAKINFYELTIVLSGKLEYAVNQKKVSACSGDMVFLPNGCERFRETSKLNVDYVSFNFFCNECPSLPYYIENIVSNKIHLLIKACDEIKGSHIENSDLIILPILKSIFLLVKTELESRSQKTFIVKIQKYIKQNLNKRISLTDIAKIVSYTPNYCDTLFKTETGKSINNYIIDLRMDEAKNLITEKSLTLKDIAHSVGFSDYNYFARTFKKRTGYTPSEYCPKA